MLALAVNNFAATQHVSRTCEVRRSMRQSEEGEEDNSMSSWIIQPKDL